MLSYSLNAEEVKLIQEYRRITTGQQQAIMLAVHELASEHQPLTANLGANVVALKRA